MKKHGRKRAANSSGQLLIIAALAIAILISSTTIYVFELGKETGSADSSLSTSDFVLAIKQSTRNTMMSSLANISNGGEKTVLTANLDELSQVLRRSNQFGICQLSFVVLNDSLYDSGTWLSWGASGIGISSTYADFTLRVYGTAANITANYAVNITTTVIIDGYFARLMSDEKLVNLTCSIYNEGEPGLAKDMNFFYENLGSWIPVNSANNLSIVDYGNGTYMASFTVDVSSDSVQVSANVYDVRNVFVQANVTCNET